MLVVYKDDGAVEQIVFHGEYDKLRAVYATIGRRVLRTDQEWHFPDIYVKIGATPDGDEIALRPEIEVSVPAAVSVGQELSLTVSPAEFSVQVLLGETPLEDEDRADGRLPLVFEVAGAYRLAFTAAFPFKPKLLELEVR